MAEEKMTKQEFIEYFKKEGFELYKTESLAPKLKAFHEMEETINQYNKTLKK